MSSETLAELLQRIQAWRRAAEPLPPPSYTPSDRVNRVFLAHHSFLKHMSSEGWQLQEGLREAGYTLYGKGYPQEQQDAREILQTAQPLVTIVQDKREWDPANNACYDKTAPFFHTDQLAADPHTFRLTIYKDLQNRPDYHRDASREIGAHAWIIYYHPQLAVHLSGFVRPQHLIRTYHSLDPQVVPAFYTKPRRLALISGAISERFYPLRSRIWKHLRQLPGVEKLNHPGYHARGTATNNYLQLLSRFKVAICTASVFGYALRKIVEATACGCVVVTDLPQDEVLPEIDENLVRIHPGIPLSQLRRVIESAGNNYNLERQRQLAARAIAWYDYRRLGRQLAEDIERLRQNYGQTL